MMVREQRGHGSGASPFWAFRSAIVSFADLALGGGKGGGGGGGGALRGLGWGGSDVHMQNAKGDHAQRLLVVVVVVPAVVLASAMVANEGRDSSEGRETWCNGRFAHVGLTSAPARAGSVWVNALPDAVFSSALEGPVRTPCSRLPGLGAGAVKVEA